MNAGSGKRTARAMAVSSHHFFPDIAFYQHFIAQFPSKARFNQRPK
jgi:hypothetical protein